MVRAAPIAEWVKAGVSVAITTDGATANCGFDFWRELDRAPWNQWLRHETKTALPPGQVLRMVTSEAAAALGMVESVGFLEADKQADVISVDPCATRLTPTMSVEHLLIFMIHAGMFGMSSSMADAEPEPPDRGCRRSD